MMMNEYVTQKLRELEEERLNRTLLGPKSQPADVRRAPKAKPVIGPALRLAGRTLRRMGAGLEDWAEPPTPESEQRLGLERRTW